MTDLLGVLEEWGKHTITVRGEDGAAVVIDRRHIVSGKPVPPRPAVRLRLTPDEVALRVADTWPAVETRRVGDWLLRAAAGFSLRANSALLAGDPGEPWEPAIAEVTGFYRGLALPVRAQVLGGSAALRRLEDDGWTDARPGMRSVLVQLAGVAGAMRALRRSSAGTPQPVQVDDRATEGWLAPDHRALDHRDAALAVLEGPAQVGFASVLGADGSVVAKGRIALSERGEVWAGLSDLWVEPGHRRRGLSTAVVAELLRWAAERGATTAYLQATEDNRPALALYERLGFVTHHSYRYLEPPRSG